MYNIFMGLKERRLEGDIEPHYHIGGNIRLIYRVVIHILELETLHRGNHIEPELYPRDIQIEKESQVNILALEKFLAAVI